MRRPTVAEVMTRDVVSVPDSAGFKEIVEVLTSRQVSAVPVVDGERRVVGVVSEADLLYKTEYADQARPASRPWERKRVRTARTKATADTAVDLMTTPAITIGLQDRVTKAAKVMDAESVKRLPVVDENGRLVGVVSRVDILRLFLRSDAEIEREVRDEVLLHTMWIDPASLSIEVDQGVVTLGGKLDQWSTIGIVVGLVQGVAGVVDVVNDLTYHTDDRGRRETGQPPIIA